MTTQQGEGAITGRMAMAVGGIILAGVAIWLWHWTDFSQPFWGSAPEMLCAIGLAYMPLDPQPLYLWLGTLSTVFAEPDLGLRLLALGSSAIGTGAVMYLVYRTTEDFVQMVLTGLLVIIFPLLMRQAVVQESGAVLFCFLSVSLGILFSDLRQRPLISGLLYGVAVGVHPTALLTLPGFAYLLKKEDETVRKFWAAGALAVALAGWLWLFFQFRSSGTTGSWIVSMLGGLGEGYGSIGVSELLSGLVRQISLHGQMFGWGGFVFGVLGVVLIAFQDRDLFWALCGLSVPFFLYQLPRVSGGDSGLFLAIYAPVYGLGLGATWRQGSDYLAEGLQETVLTMLWVFAVTMIIIQVVCVNYTENIWTMALQQRAAAQPRLEEIIDLSAEIQQYTQPGDFLVVIPDPGRPTPLGMASSPWAIVWQSKRQVVWADRTPTGWDFHTISQNPGHALHWMNQTVAVDDAFLTHILKGGSRLFSPEPFPFLHASQVTVWMSGLPAPGFEAGTMYRLVPGWPKAENPDAVVEALRKSFDAYVARGYSSDGAACLEGIISHHPGDLETYRKLGDLYMNLSIFKRASEIYAKLHLLAPGDPEVVVNLSGAHYSQGNLASAISVCEDFLASKSLSPDVIFNLGGYYQRANRNADALKMYEAYLALGDLGEKREEVKELIGSLKRE